MPRATTRLTTSAIAAGAARRLLGMRDPGQFQKTRLEMQVPDTLLTQELIKRLPDAPLPVALVDALSKLKCGPASNADLWYTTALRADKYELFVGLLLSDLDPASVQRAATHVGNEVRSFARSGTPLPARVASMCAQLSLNLAGRLAPQWEQLTPPQQGTLADVDTAFSSSILVPFLRLVQAGGTLEDTFDVISSQQWRVMLKHALKSTDVFDTPFVPDDVLPWAKSAHDVLALRQLAGAARLGPDAPPVAPSRPRSKL
jgi:hypothetical protein